MILKAIPIFLFAILLTVSLAEAKNTAVLSISNLQHDDPLPEKPTYTTPSKPVQTIVKRSSGGSGCITDSWVWNGEFWQGRDLRMLNGKTLSGKYCTPFDLATRKAIPKPKAPPANADSMSFYNEAIDIRWWTSEYQKKSQKEVIKNGV